MAPGPATLLLRTCPSSNGINGLYGHGFYGNGYGSGYVTVEISHNFCWVGLAYIDLTLALSLPVEHRPPTTLLHPALFCAALHLHPAVLVFC